MGYLYFTSTYLYLYLQEIGFFVAIENCRKDTKQPSETAGLSAAHKTADTYL